MARERVEGGARHTQPVPGAERDSVFVLVHSPLLGPTSWSLVASALEARDREVLVPPLRGSGDPPPPRWPRAVESVRTAATRIASPIVLVGHSGAGPLLPSIADDLSAEVAALVFVDASVPPASGAAPLVPPGFLDQLRAISADGVLPRWSSWFGEDTMRELVPEAAVREALEQEMPRLPLAFFEEGVPVPARWADRPCAFLLLTEAYGESAADARGRGWPVSEIPDVQHLAPVTDPIAVTDALLQLEAELANRT
jgi:pimeloyl-ACP methyl ester carboxylesterase